MDHVIPASAIISSVVGVVLLALLAFFICRHKQQKRTRTTSTLEENNDENPVYGMYYFADGQHIDNETAEVQDENEYYGS